MFFQHAELFGLMRRNLNRWSNVHGPGVRAIRSTRTSKSESMLFPLLTYSRRIPRPESDGTHWPPIAFEQIPNGAGHCSQALPFIRLISQLLLVTSHS